MHSLQGNNPSNILAGPQWRCWLQKQYLRDFLHFLQSMKDSIDSRCIVCGEFSGPQKRHLSTPQQGNLSDLRIVSTHDNAVKSISSHCHFNSMGYERLTPQ